MCAMNQPDTSLQPDSHTFFNEWLACLRSHYVHVVRIGDHVTEPTLREVLLQTGLSAGDIDALREEALETLPPDERAALEQAAPGDDVADDTATYDTAPDAIDPREPDDTFTDDPADAPADAPHHRDEDDSDAEVDADWESDLASDFDADASTEADDTDDDAYDDASEDSGEDDTPTQQLSLF